MQNKDNRINQNRRRTGFKKPIVFHPQNRHQGQYDFKKLIAANPNLKQYVKLNPYGTESINFHNPAAVKELNRSLLFSHYAINYWDIPAGFLCPPIPGRAEYIHHAADLLKNDGVPLAEVKCLDIGVGANCIYPLIASLHYGWNVVGSDCSKEAVASARLIAEKNELQELIVIREQRNSKHFLKGIIQTKERFHLTICNPPFHKSAAEAKKGSARKTKNLGGKKNAKLNFGGQNNELWCEGGEYEFVLGLIEESKTYASSVLWFSSLVAKDVHLKGIYAALKRAGTKEVKTVNMAQGNKQSRFVAWSFLNPVERKNWINERNEK